jgi:Kef-type K+ transport system membrane component KefB
MVMLRKPSRVVLPTSVVLVLGVIGAVAGMAAEVEPHGHAAHVDPFSFVLLQLAGVIVVAMVGRWGAARINQPSVLGELSIGVIVGNIGYWLGSPLFVLIMHFGEVEPLFAELWRTGLPIREVAASIFAPAQLMSGGIGTRVIDILTGPGASHWIVMGAALWMFSNLGVIVLLFMVGLESTVHDMLAVGLRALAVAVLGIAAPFLLGFGATQMLLPDAPTTVDLFLGATLSATSVGITARVFKDLGKLQMPEAKVILGAAVIDDILGLIILAIVVGIVASGGVQLGAVIRIGGFSAVFLGVVILFGERLVKAVIPLMRALDPANLRLLFPLCLACALAWMASQIELATIVGAFAAGLILNEEFFPESDGEKTATIGEVMHPLEAIFAPVFFVLMGMQVNLETFGSLSTIGMALALTVAAVVGKLVAGIPAGAGVDRVSVGIGMIPRGEVGLIFASIGKGLGVVTDALFSAVVIMVILTTLMAPLLLKWSLSRGSRLAL